MSRLVCQVRLGCFMVQSIQHYLFFCLVRMIKKTWDPYNLHLCYHHHCHDNCHHHYYLHYHHFYPRYRHHYLGHYCRCRRYHYHRHYCCRWLAYHHLNYCRFRFHLNMAAFFSTPYGYLGQPVLFYIFVNLFC